MVPITDKTIRTVRPGDFLLFCMHDEPYQPVVFQVLSFYKHTSMKGTLPITKKYITYDVYSRSAVEPVDIRLSPFLRYMTRRGNLCLLTKHELTEIKMLYSLNVLDREALNIIRNRPKVVSRRTSSNG